MAMVRSNIQSSSSSSSRMIRKYYDVFVSFRGKDTRYNFTDHLFGALQRKGILAFKDDTKLEKGESIAPELEKAIEGSQVLIVVFSKNYASSTWCLRELAKIQVSGKCVLPIFYDVDPSEVRKQSGNYKKAFAKHEERFKDDKEKMVEVKRWREALTQVANLSGYDIRNKSQYKEIQKIVQKIIRIVGYNSSSLPNDIVGMQSPLEELKNCLLLDKFDDVRVVGICGMGGIGKSTLATTLYNKISHQFDACCIIDDVSKIHHHSGAIGVQKQLLKQTLEEEKFQISNLCDGTNLMNSRLRHTRALIILDNVDQAVQLEKLALKREQLRAGSRIIIISRDKHILKEYGVDVVYEVPLLGGHDSLQLFNKKAFKCDYTWTNYEELVHCFVNYANGLPLAIKVLGSFLYDRDVSDWRSALARLRETPNKDIMDVLHLSFDGLEEMEKEIFLDIACFFAQGPEEYVEYILNCCGFHADIGMRVLSDKSLIEIHIGEIQMHDLLIELGRKISKEKWSRLWLPKYFDNVMSEDMAKNVEAIAINEDDLTKSDVLNAEDLSKMSHLRLLRLCSLNLKGNLDHLSNELRYVDWLKYPFEYLPSNFQPNQLVHLSLENSNIKQLWKGKKYLPNLKTLDLSYSKNLIKMPNFEEVPNLESLDLKECVKLVQLDPSIGVLNKLKFLNLRNCKSLVSIPDNILGLSSLEYLDLSGCSKVSIKSMYVKHWKKHGTGEIMLHPQSKSSFLKWFKLPFNLLHRGAHEDPGSFSCFSPSFPSFSRLLQLDISDCGLCQVPDLIGYIRCLEGLTLSGNNFVKLPSLKELTKLIYLNLSHCKKLMSLPELPSHTRLPSYASDSLPPVRGRLRAMMHIYNCPKLCKKGNWSSKIILWMIQVIKAQRESYSYPYIEIVVPESEIPRWFHYQSVGGRMSIDNKLYDNNWIGLACCVVFVVNHDPTISSNPNYFTANIWLSDRCLWATTLYRDLNEIQSNHMWLIYFPRKILLAKLSRSSPLNHELDIRSGYSMGFGVYREVKKVGCHWLNEQDLEQLGVTTMHRGNSSALKRKFLAIEEGAQTQP